MSRFRQQAVGAGYLGASLLGAVNAANAVRPLTRRGQGAVMAFGAGMVASEAPAVYAAAQAATTAAALRAGAARTATGRAGLALTAATELALLGVRLRARPATDIVERALVEALGPDYRQRVRQPAWPEEGAPLGKRPGLVRLMQVRRRYAHDADLSYGPAGSRNHLDIWRRKDLPAGGRAPVLVQVHGGAWAYGNKQGQAYPLMSHLAERGWVCVSLNYRLAPRGTWPDMILDVKRAVAWVKQHIAEYGGDPDFIAITGGSAGGHLSSLHALTAADRRWQPGFEDVDTTVRAAVPFYGVYDWTDPDLVDLQKILGKRVVKRRFGDARDVYREASPRWSVRPDAPPFFMFHGTNDSLVPVSTARTFARELREVSRAPVAYAELPGAQHAFDTLSSVRSHACAEAVERFLGVVYGDYVRAAEVPPRPTVAGSER